jgi:hypothetical protein
MIITVQFVAWNAGTVESSMSIHAALAAYRWTDFTFIDIDASCCSVGAEAFGTRADRATRSLVASINTFGTVAAIVARIAKSAFITPVIAVDVTIARPADWHTLSSSFVEARKPPVFGQTIQLQVTIRPAFFFVRAIKAIWFTVTDPLLHDALFPALESTFAGSCIGGAMLLVSPIYAVF